MILRSRQVSFQALQHVKVFADVSHLTVRKGRVGRKGRQCNTALPSQTRGTAMQTTSVERWGYGASQVARQSACDPVALSRSSELQHFPSGAFQRAAMYRWGGGTPHAQMFLTTQGSTTAEDEGAFRKDCAKQLHAAPQLQAGQALTVGAALGAPCADVRCGVWSTADLLGAAGGWVDRACKCREIVTRSKCMCW